MANQKTPGVYVEEISLLPPSVAPVATAIPAFIGYTDKINLLLKPTRISSMLEYRNLFGDAYPQDDIKVEVTGNSVDKVVGLDNTPSFKMYYALQMYFANGGGPCYIVSIGEAKFDTLVNVADHEEGLAVLEKEYEPTLIVSPDATRLSTPIDYYSVMNKALEQSNKLQDRFTIVDTYTDAPIGSANDPILQLRNGLRNEEEYRKYGAAYYPYLKTIIDYHYKDDKVDVKLSGQNFTDQFAVLINQNITNGANVSLTANLDILLTLLNELKDLDDNPSPALTSAERQECVDALELLVVSLQQYVTAFEELKNIGVYVQGLLETPNTSLNAAVTALNTWIGTNLTAHITTLNGLITTFLADNPATIVTVNNAIVALEAMMIAVFDFDPAPNNTFGFIDSVIEPCLVSGPVYVLEDVLSTIQTNGIDTTLADVKQYNNLLYNQIKQAIADVPMLLPPSSAIAGVYARVDNNLGVWRAPANTSLTYVIEPSRNVSAPQQEDLNVTTTGKSINAIRSFIGKGTLVWGARTLDGNSSEWRFINVRRTYIFIETSLRRATEPFVFQSNDANTWVKVRGMIQAFLTLQWKAGALAGASTEQAFYVNIGLGSTMTSQDILDGVMVVEVGLAVVRPAEFIVLRFTHKMQEI